MNTPLELDGGGTARIQECQGDHVTLTSSRPYPPGATLSARCNSVTISIKVRGSRRLGPDEFRVEGRFVSLSRTAREAILGYETKPNS